MTDISAAINAELARIALLDADALDVEMRLVGHQLFLTGDPQQLTITMNVPTDADFMAKRFNLYIGARRYDAQAPFGETTDRTFRPAAWTCVNNTVSYARDVNNAVGDASCEWLLSDTWNGEYSNAPISIGSAYSAQYGFAASIVAAPWTAWPGGMVFDVPQLVRRGSTVTVKVSPSFSRVVNATVKTQFRVTAELWGHKKRSVR